LTQQVPGTLLVALFASSDDYRHNAMELMRLAERAQSSAEKTRLVTLAEGWIELAEKAHKDNLRPRQPTILHPLVEKKMGRLPD
jgi:hypothetical protein